MWLDSLKGIAICGVVMVHCGTLTSAPIDFLNQFISFGAAGVQIFFLISSYLSFASYEKRYIKSGSDFKNNVKWILQKIIRLIPLYYLSLLCGLLEGGQAYWLGSEKSITFLNALTHITFTHGFFPHYINSIIGCEWYIGTLVIFYCLTPILYKIINSAEKSVFFVIFGNIISFISCYVSYSVVNNETVVDSNIYLCYFSDFSFFTQLPVISLGIFIYYVFKSNIFDNLELRKLLSYSLLFVGALLIIGMIFGKSSLYGIVEFSLLGVAFTLIIISQYINVCPLIDNVLFRVLGRYSYPIYLFHFLFIRLYGKNITITTGNVVFDWLLKYIIVLTITFVISLFLQKFVEKPLVKKLKNILENVG